MLTKNTILETIAEQVKTLANKSLINRQVDIPSSIKKILIISGIRRCGKSTLIRKRFLNENNAYYVNFEDPRLINFELSDFTRLEELYFENNKKYLLLDEIQNINNWEIYVRSAHEKGIPIIITGPNASLLSKELGTKLTGRYKQLELFPFNFSEFLDFTDKERSFESFKNFFELGGFPEFIEEPDTDYHRTLLRDIVTRDIAVRRKLQNENQILRLAVHLLSNIGKKFSFNKLSNLLEIKSVRTVIDYCDYLNESYLLDFVPMYSTSIKKQIANPKKVYAIDAAFAQSNSLSFSKDLGHRLENMVYNKLRYQNKEIFYYRTPKLECDFLVKTNESISQAIQVCWEVNNDNIKREINGLKAALEETNIDSGIIITYNQEDNIDGIQLIPVWKWL
ncbi:MAG: AAA family ATPase [Salinivirgaceae bacterium]|nr:MAG: AAA family ATPase [Salinivirgaceae bacterium]